MIQTEKSGEGATLTRSASQPKKISSFFYNGLGISLMAGAVVLFSSGGVLAETTLKIVSPKNGAEVSKNVSVKYAYHKEGRADHVHVFVDGNFLEATHKDPVPLTLEAGHHTILLRAASAHHNLLKARASVDVTVK